MFRHRYTPLIIAAAVAILVFAAYQPKDEERPAQPLSSVAEPTRLETAALLRKAEVGLPLRVTIPDIGVDAQVIFVGLTPKGAIDVPKGPKEVAWFDLGPRPGERGTSILVGHYGPWINGDSSVFSSLDRLAPGDKVLVHDSKGKALSFTVKGSQVFDPAKPAPEVFAQSDGFHLNIITCNGEWLSSQQTYDKRLVVFTELD